MLDNKRWSKRNFSLRLLTLSSAALATTISASPVYSQSDGTNFVDEIIVTARRKSESLQDAPGSITAITSDTLEKAGVQRAGDFLSLTPGVTLVNSAEVGDTQVNIRGINGARDAENSFAFVIDGVLYTCLLYTSPSPRDKRQSRMPSSA